MARKKKKITTIDKAKKVKAKPTKVKVKAKPKAKPKSKSKAKPKSKPKSVAIDNEAVALFDYDGLNSKIEQRFRLTAEEMSLSGSNEYSISTGMLMIDIVMGNNGLKPGSWVTLFGLEQSAKSTLKSKILVSSTVKHNVPINWDCDYEGSTDIKYLFGMSGVHPRDIYGERDDNGKWVVKPKAHYYSLSSAELFFDSASALLRRLPDVEYHKGKWYYVMPNTKTAQAFVKKNPDDKKLFQEHGKKLRFIERPEGGAMQAIFYIDSYSAMNPNDTEEEEEKGKGLSERARMFSENVSKIRAKLRAKRACVVGVNQLRLRPMARGNPEYEPNGETLKFASDIRLKQTSRANSALSSWEEDETSMIKKSGYDKYRYFTIHGWKNKLAIPKLKVWTRLWTTDHRGIARGYDPYFDVFQYLQTTGQLTGTTRGYTISLEVTAKRTFSFKAKRIDLKVLVLYPYMKELKYPSKDLVKLKSKYEEFLSKVGLKSKFDLRKECFTQLHSGKGYELFLDTTGASDIESEEDSDSSSSSSSDMSSS